MSAPGNTTTTTTTPTTPTGDPKQHVKSHSGRRQSRNKKQPDPFLDLPDDVLKQAAAGAASTPSPKSDNQPPHSLLVHVSTTLPDLSLPCGVQYSKLTTHHSSSSPQSASSASSSPSSSSSANNDNGATNNNSKSKSKSNNKTPQPPNPNPADGSSPVQNPIKNLPKQPGIHDSPGEGEESPRCKSQMSWR